MEFLFQHPLERALLLLALLLIWLPPAARGQRPIAFDHIVVDPAGPRDPWGKCVADLNGDGAPDLIVGGNVSGGLVWYENPSWSSHVISGLAGFRTDQEPGDIDQDGHTDVVSLGTDSAGRLWVGWFKNPGSAGGDWTSRTIDTIALHDIEVADLDGDGRIDVVARNQEVFAPGHGDTLYLYYQRPHGWSKYRITCANGEGLKVSDINRDARPDITISGSWFENTGADTLWIAHPYTATFTYRSVTVDVADIDGDSLVDILLAPSEPIGDVYRISWFKAPPDPDQPAWTEHVVEDGVETVHHSLGTADFDNNGTVDIASAKMHSGLSLPEVKVFLNQGEGLAWTKQVIATTGSHGMRVADLDGNGSKDLFGANWRGDGSDLWLNQPDTLVFSMLVADDAGASQRLEFGLGRYATDSIDAVMREAELPAPPAPGRFDARFVGAGTGVHLGLGTHRDFRRGDSSTVGVRTHELQCQVQPGGSLTFAVDLPPQVSLRFHASTSGSTVDTTLRGQESYTVSNPPSPLNLVISATYVLSKPNPPRPRSPDHGAVGVEPAPLLAWSPVDYCLGYHLQAGARETAGGAQVVDTVVADTMLQLPRLDSLTTYWWRVSGINPAGEGEFSDPWAFETREFISDQRTLGLWRLNETAGDTVFDLTLHENNGVATGTSVGTGRYGASREFNGSSDYIDLPESPSLLARGRKLTIEAWLHLDSYPPAGEAGTVISTGNQRDYELSVNSEGHLKAYMYSDSGSDSCEAGFGLPLRTWVHVAMSFDGSLIRLFVNGVEKAREARSDQVGGSPEPEDFLLGASVRTGNLIGLLAGSLDEVSILNVARPPRDFPLQLPPAALEATPGPGQVRLTWQNGGGGVPLSKYRVYRGADSASASLLDSTGGTWFADTTGTPLLDYVYRVTAVDVTGFEGVPSATGLTAAKLGLPVLLSPSNDQPGIPPLPAFAWMTVRGAQRYRLQVYADSSLTQPITDDVTPDTSRVLDRPLERGRRHYWRVCALRSEVEGAWSEVRSFVTAIPPPTPSDPVYPPDNATISGDTVVCVWTSSTPMVERYWFELASDSLFVVRTVDSTLTDTMTTVRNILSARQYWWRVRAYNASGWSPYSAVRTFTSPVTSAEDGRDVPLEFGLSQNYPNPFNPETTIRFQIPIGAHVRVSLFDLLGREVSVLVDEWRDAGRYSVNWDGTQAASGVYVCRLSAGPFAQTRRMMLLR